MKFLIFVVRDRALDEYLNPMMMRSAGEALRSFQDEINRADEKNPLFAHPEDFDLYALGSYDSASGLYDTDSPRMIGIGKDLKR